jgi:tRNA(fMet)-specific endonuclease VapC
MTYLIDSDRVADYLKGHPEAVILLNQLWPDGIAISIITYAEVYEGIYYGRDAARNEAIFDRFVRGVRVLPITRGVAQEFARLRGHLRARGQIIPQPDLFIAATAIQYNLLLVTRNLRHFTSDRFPSLRIYSP